MQYSRTQAIILPPVSSSSSVSLNTLVFGGDISSLVPKPCAAGNVSSSFPKCHLPNIPVAYPAAVMASAMVTFAGSRWDVFGMGCRRMRWAGPRFVLPTAYTPCRGVY